VTFKILGSEWDTRHDRQIRRALRDEQLSSLGIRISTK
jgi:hypothetical protein